MKKTILYIDDEIKNLESFKINFWHKYTVLTTSCTKIAEKLLKENSVDLVISDYEMPSESGCQFISRISPLFPHLSFIILSGKEREHTTVCNNVKKWITKPYEYKELELIIETF